MGQQQRVAVARATLIDLALVLADETDRALDETRMRGALEVIRSLCTETKASLLLVTHDAAIATTLERRFIRD